MLSVKCRFIVLAESTVNKLYRSLNFFVITVQIVQMDYFISVINAK